MNQTLNNSLERLFKIEPELACNCYRALSVLGSCEIGLGEDPEFMDILDEAAVYGVIMANAGKTHLASEYLKVVLPPKGENDVKKNPDTVPTNKHRPSLPAGKRGSLIQ